MTPSSGRIDTCPMFCVALCWRDPGSPSQPLLSLSACCPPQVVPLAEPRTPVREPGPGTHHCAVFHLRLPGVHGLSPKGPHLQLQIRIVGLPLLRRLGGQEMGGLGGCPRRPSMVQPRGASLFLSVCRHLPLLSMPWVPQTPRLPPPSPTLVFSGQYFNAPQVSIEGPSPVPLSMGGRGRDRLARTQDKTQRPDLPGITLPALGENPTPSIDDALRRPLASGIVQAPSILRSPHQAPRYTSSLLPD